MLAYPAQRTVAMSARLGVLHIVGPRSVVAGRIRTLAAQATHTPVVEEAGCGC